MRIFIFFLMVFLASFPVRSEMKQTPCVSKVRGKWKIVKGTECVQMGRDAHIAYNSRLLKLRYYMKDFEPKTKRERELSQKMIKLWEGAFSLCEKKFKVQENICKQFQALSNDWKARAENIQKLQGKMCRRSWAESPILWFSVGFVAATGVIAGTSAILNSLPSASK